MTAEALNFGVDVLRPLCLPEGVPPSELGAMTLERWEELVGQFAQLGLVDANKVKARRSFQDTSTTKALAATESSLANGRFAEF